MKEVKRLVIVCVIAVFFIGFYFLCAKYAGTAREYYAKSDGAEDKLYLENLSIEEAVWQYVHSGIEKHISIAGTGDIMVYDYQMERAYKEAEESFDFSPAFQYISSYLKGYDYVVGNLETTLAGKDNGTMSNSYGYWADSTTMNFNAPEQIAADLKTAGFSMVTTANNHANDSGINGLFATIDALDAAGLEHTGSFKNTDDVRYTIKNVNGINVGIIAWSAIAPTTALEEQYSYALNYIADYSDSSIAQMCSQIKEMHNKGADCIIVYMHWGDKYAQTPTDDQKNLANQLVKAGADVIFGSYPHVLQPMEMISVTNEDGTSHQGVVFYSLGNFLSSMQYQSENGYNRDLGAIAGISFTKTPEGTKMTAIELIPTYVDWTDTNIAVMPICEVKDNSNDYSELLDYLDVARIDAGYESVIKTIIGDSGLQYDYSNYKYKISLGN